MPLSAPTPAATAAAYALGLALTLALAGCLTPRHWWRRPTAGNVLLTGAATLALGVLFCLMFAALMPPARPARLGEPLPFAEKFPPPPAHLAPATRYRVIDDLNLRAARATGAPRLAVLPAGTLVTPTGALDGDWLQVRARVRGQPVEGWASSLWLRRVDERRLGED
ncbi:SH3 domain-containing protein [Massilia aerilata]|uniref:SH3 domain-containing protein n=1 Tax=Massilia aerilata TaxID=453817 RepID=A0ABW0RWL2_9BURK